MTHVDAFRVFCTLLKKISEKVSLDYLYNKVVLRKSLVLWYYCKIRIIGNLCIF